MPGRRRSTALLAAAAALLLAACTGSSDNSPSRGPSGNAGSSSGGAGGRTSPAGPSGGSSSSTSVPPSSTSSPTQPAGTFTISFAGDVHFSGRIRDRLDRDPATVFGPAAAVLRRADLTMVNLETAVTNGGDQQSKEFTFRAPPEAFGALRDAGVDVATMANNHGADFGESGLRDSLAAIKAAHFPVVGIGRNAAAAYAPYRTTLNGVRVAIIGADQVQDETTLRLFSAGADTPGVANAFSDRLLQSVRAAKAAGYVVVVYVHWGIEYTTCPSSLQRELAGKLADAGATAIIGTHAHVLQGAGWRADGRYVEYGLGNYLWWRTFGNNQDDNGVLTLTFERDRVTRAAFTPSKLDDRGVPVPATGAEKTRIADEWKADRQCADLSATPPH